MPIWNQLGMQAAGNAISGAMGLILGNINDRRQLRQQQKLQDQQIRGTKELTDYNYLKQMQLWNDTNYPAQMAMLKKAGLNPALIYDNGGMQAETTISPGDVQGTDAPKGGGEAMALMNGQNLALTAAQIENIKAQTEKTKAETTAVAPGIQKTQAETQSITQGINNQKAEEALLDAQRYATNIASDINARSSNSQVALWAKRVQRETEAVRQDLRENNINDKLINEKIAALTAEYAGKAIDNVLKQANIAKTGAEIYEIITRAQTYIIERMLHADEVTIKSGQHNLERADWLENLNDFPDIQGIISGIIGGILGGKMTATRPNEIRGLHKR